MATAPTRSRNGWSFLFDPSGEIECPASVERVGWSPLTTAANWDAAVQTSDAMVNASRLAGGQIARRRRPTLDRTSQCIAVAIAPCRGTRIAPDANGLAVDRSPRWRHAAAKFCRARSVRTPPPPTCWPASSAPIPVSSQVSGPPHRVSWRPTGRRPRWHPPSSLRSMRPNSCAGPTPCTSARPAAGSTSSHRSSSAAIGDVRDATYDRERSGERSTPDTARSRRGCQHRPHSRSADHAERGCRAGTSRDGMPAGPLAGPWSLGIRRRWLSDLVRHHGGVPRDRRCRDAARPQRPRR